MFEVTILASGSSGNATLVRSEGATILVDAGLSRKQLLQRLSLCSLDASDIDAIFITHEHGDHIKGLSQWCKHYATPLYCNRHTATLLREKIGSSVTWKIFETGSSLTIADLSIRSFSIPHDAVDPVGFIFREKKYSFGLATDLGHASRLVLDALGHLDALLLEANYDNELLEQDRKRPWAVKQRISSRHGHLSNGDAAALLEQLLHEELRYVVLGHLSSDCNKEHLVFQALQKVRSKATSTQYWCAQQDTISQKICL